MNDLQTTCAMDEEEVEVRVLMLIELSKKTGLKIIPMFDVTKTFSRSEFLDFCFRKLFFPDADDPVPMT